MLKLKNNLLLILGLFSALSLAGDLNKQLIAVAKQIVENVAEVQRLIAAGVDINTVDSYYESTPLFEACANGHLKIVRLLLDQADIKINKATITGLTPLHIACTYNQLDVLKLLLTREDLDINRPSLTGLTPLMIASQYGYTAIVEILKKKLRKMRVGKAYVWLGVEL